MWRTSTPRGDQRVGEQGPVAARGSASAHMTAPVGTLAASSRNASSWSRTPASPCGRRIRGRPASAVDRIGARGVSSLPGRGVHVDDYPPPAGRRQRRRVELGVPARVRDAANIGEPFDSMPPQPHDPAHPADASSARSSTSKRARHRPPAVVQRTVARPMSTAGTVMDAADGGGHDPSLLQVESRVPTFAAEIAREPALQAI